MTFLPCLSSTESIYKVDVKNKKQSKSQSYVKTLKPNPSLFEGQVDQDTDLSKRHYHHGRLRESPKNANLKEKWNSVGTDPIIQKVANLYYFKTMLRIATDEIYYPQ